MPNYTCNIVQGRNDCEWWCTTHDQRAKGDLKMRWCDHCAAGAIEAAERDTNAEDRYTRQQRDATLVACQACGQRFDLSTKCLPSEGEAWTGYFGRFASTGVCPACHWKAHENGSIRPWNPQEWKEHLHRLIEAATTSTEIGSPLLQMISLRSPDLTTLARERKAQLSADEALARQQSEDQKRREAEKTARKLAEQRAREKVEAEAARARRRQERLEQLPARVAQARTVQEIKRILAGNTGLLPEAEPCFEIARSRCDILAAQEEQARQAAQKRERRATFGRNVSDGAEVIARFLLWGGLAGLLISLLAWSWTPLAVLTVVGVAVGVALAARQATDSSTPSTSPDDDDD